MPHCVVARRIHFNAAHRLHNPAHSDAWNRETFGPCNNPNYHGHNYELDILVEGELDPETGYVVDVAVLKRLADEHIVAQLDHKNLNLDVSWFRDGEGEGRLNPTAENIARVCWRVLAPVQLQTVCVRHERDGLQGEALDRHTLAWVDRINKSGAAYLTPAVLEAGKMKGGRSARTKRTKSAFEVSRSAGLNRRSKPTVVEAFELIAVPQSEPATWPGSRGGWARQPGPRCP